MDSRKTFWDFADLIGSCKHQLLNWVSVISTKLGGTTYMLYLWGLKNPHVIWETCHSQPLRPANFFLFERVCLLTPLIGGPTSGVPSAPMPLGIQGDAGDLRKTYISTLSQTCRSQTSMPHASAHATSIRAPFTRCRGATPALAELIFVPVGC